MGVLTCPVPAAGSEGQGCSAARMWRSACATLVAPDSEKAWQKIVDTSPPDKVWHSLRNCVAYQAGVWQNLLSKGMDDVIQPAAFKLAIVLRHTPTDLSVRLLSDLLRLHPQSQDLTSYILALLTDDEAEWSDCSSSSSSSPGSPTSTMPGDPVVSSTVADGAEDAEGADGTDGGEAGECAGDTGNEAAEAGEAEPRHSSPPPPPPAAPPGPAPLRDLQLFGDCELAVMAASREEYEAHAKLVRAEYSKLTNKHYVELRIRVLNQFSQIPKLFHTPEFECFESAARENIEREINTLREHLHIGRTGPS